MGLKENIQVVKKEISTEEQFLEGMIKSERFFKRNKKYIFSAVALIVLGVSGYTIDTLMTEQRLKASNEAYTMLLKDANNTSAQGTLKQKNPKLALRIFFIG